MKRKTCSRCRRAESVCYCHTIKPVANVWPIHILQHPTESQHAIGTARIAELSLSQCELQVADRFDIATVVNHWDEESKPVLVYPGENAMSVDEIKLHRPGKLIFLDASWRKSRRMLFESPYLMDLARVSFEPETASQYRIRKVPNPNALSTLEAIVHVLSVLEGKGNQYQPLLDSMNWMIEKQIECMGEEIFLRNYNR
ncbi:MAG: DTW domain-containing protein [Pseudomonadales bacterium]|nr:DTW domain-containing protein [Pseudomonadales bacterium]